MKIHNLILVATLIIVFSVQAISQTPKIYLHILKVDIENGVEGIDALGEEIDHDFEPYLIDALKRFPNCIEEAPNSIDKQLADIFFKGQNAKYLREYKVDEKLPIPKKTNAVLIAKYKYTSSGHYIELKILTNDGTSPIQEYHTWYGASQYVLHDPKNRKIFLNKLFDKTFSGLNIQNLVSRALGIDRVEVQCLDPEKPPKPDFSFSYDQANKKAPARILFKNESKDFLTVQWTIKRKRLFSKTKVIKRLEIDTTFYRSGPYIVSLTATGYNGNTIETKKRKISVKCRKPKEGQYWLAGSGGAFLLTSGITYLESNKYYDKHKLGSNPKRELDYEKANTLHHVSFVTFYVGTALVAGSVLWYIIDADKPKEPKATTFFPVIDIQQNNTLSSSIGVGVKHKF